MKTELALADADTYDAETLTASARTWGPISSCSGSYVTVGEGETPRCAWTSGCRTRAKGETRRRQRERQGRRAPRLVSRAAAGCASGLGSSAPATATASVRASQPASPEAARLYAEGLIRLRRFDALGARAAVGAGDCSRSAVPARHSALARTWSALGYDERARDAAARAFELSANLPRADRLAGRGHVSTRCRSEWKEAIAIWQTLSTFFPDDVEHALRLANAQIASGAAKEGLATVEDFRTRFPGEGPAARACGSHGGRDAVGLQADAGRGGGGRRRRQRRRAHAARRRRDDARGRRLLRMGQTRTAVQLFEEARRHVRDAGDRAGVARSLNNLASAMSDGPDTARGRGAVRGRPRDRTRDWRAGPGGAASSTTWRSRSAAPAIFKASLKMNQESLAIRREIGDRTNTAISLNNIGNVLLDLGDFQGASRALRAVGRHEPRDRRSARVGARAAQCGRVAEAAG